MVRNESTEVYPCYVKKQTEPTCWEKHHIRYTDDTTLMAESKEKLKSLLMKVKESEKVG